MSRREREFSITCDDCRGTLSHLAKILGDANVNIVATGCITAGAQGAVRFIVDDVPRAKRTLDREHLSYTEHDVLCVELPNLSGPLANFTGKLATQDINVTTVYGTATKGSKKAIIIFRVSDLDKAAGIR